MANILTQYGSEYDGYRSEGWTWDYANRNDLPTQSANFGEPFTSATWGNSNVTGEPYDSSYGISNIWAGDTGLLEPSTKIRLKGPDTVFGGVVSSRISQVFRFYLTTSTPLTTFSIPLGSRITGIEPYIRLEYTADRGWFYTTTIWARSRLSRSPTFDPNWVDDPDTNRLTKTRPWSSSSLVTAFSQRPIGNWNVDNDTAWDFIAGDANISGRVYCYCWFENPQFLSDNNVGLAISALRLRRVRWMPPGQDSTGILLGDL